MLPLYEDEGVVVTRDYILIKKYYFPLATSKTILYSEMAYISMQDATDVNHRWGPCSKYLNNWFPYDSHRKTKAKFIEFVIKGKKMRPSITPEDPEALFAVLSQLLSIKKQQEQPQKEQITEKNEEKDDFWDGETIPTASFNQQE